MNDQKQTRNSEDWEIAAGPEPVVAWEERLWPGVTAPRHSDSSAAWVWTLRRHRTGEIRELVLRVTWKGFDSIREVPAAKTREAFASAGRPGVDWFLEDTFDGWHQIIYHSQTRSGPHGSTGRYEIVRLS